MNPDGLCAPTVEWRCLKCREIPWSYRDWWTRGEVLEIHHHESFAALEESAALGCYLCRSLRMRLIHRKKPEELTGGPCFLRFEFFDERYQINEFYVGETCIEFYLWKSDDPTVFTAPSNKIKRFAPENLDGDLQSLIRERIKPWIEDCLQQRGSHASCGTDRLRGHEPASLPTRLIDLGKYPTEHLRLVETRDESFRGCKPEYLALSYCWGQSNEPAKTTRSTVQTRKQKIHMTELPKTIQDAILFTRLMGIRYLWVDAVCIIQPHSGDEYLADWEIEAQRMASYYSNAHCLISALGASDSNGGIFSERLAQRYQSANCPIAFDVASNEYLYISVDEPVLRVETVKLGQPLLERGWYLQERLSSPRSLLWSTNCLFWRCQSMYEASEFDPEESFASTPRSLRLDEHHIFQQSASSALGSSWNNLMGHYSTTRFTYKTDRLVAIQSLGNRLATLHGVSYFAGIFDSHVFQGLLWFSNSSKEDGYSEKLPYFPSWSWASCTTGIQVFFDDRNEGGPLFRYSRPDYFPSTAKPTDLSDPSPAALYLEAPLWVTTPEQEQIGPSGQFYQCPFRFTEKTLNLEVDFTFDAHSLVPEPFGTLHFLILKLNQVPVYPWLTATGLVVRPRGQYYERIGYAKIRSPPKSTKKDRAKFKSYLDKIWKEVVLV